MITVTMHGGDVWVYRQLDNGKMQRLAPNGEWYNVVIGGHTRPTIRVK